MKILAFFICSFLLIISVKAIEQPFSFSIKSVSLAEALKVIENRTGYSFLYAKEDLFAFKSISLEVRGEAISAVLEKLLTPLALTYTIEKKIVIIRKERFEGASFLSVKNEISGVVLDENGLPLSGAAVRQIGGETVLTNSQGRFSLTLKGNQLVLEASFIGYLTQRVDISDSIGRFSIKMQPLKSVLDAVEVIAYGTTTKRLSTGNTGGIRAVDIERQPVGNALQALQGKIPGIIITAGSGTPGATMTVRIQGTNSLRGGNNPFYVVDGVPFSSSTLNTGTNGGNAAMWGQPAGSPVSENYTPSLDNPGSGSPLSYLNPSDIESIEVLKDADATAIYGSRAANGAILITTKKGKPGAMSVGLNIRNGWSKVVRRVKLLNAPEYLAMRREAFSNSNTAPSTTAYDLNGTWDTTNVTDWQEYFLGKSTQYFDGQLSLSGGTAFTNYLVSTSFRRSELMLPGSFSDKNYAVHLSLRNESANRRFKTQLTVNYLVNNNRLPGGGVTTDMLTMSPVHPSLLKPDGSINWAPNKSGVSSITRNPLASLANQYVIDVNNLVTNLAFSYQILKGLEFKTSLGYTYNQSNDISTDKTAAMSPERINRGTLRSAVFRYNTMRSYLVEPELKYQFMLSDIKTDVLIAGVIQKNQNNGRGLIGTGQSGDNLLLNLSAAPIIAPVAEGDLDNIYRYNAVFGRVNFNYSDKYIMNLTARRDGSSRFGRNNRFHNFGAIGLAWILSKESFLKLPSFISFAKLRASYGTTGNDQIGDYIYLDLYKPVSVGLPYQGIGSISTVQIVNDQLQWESTHKASAGFDIGFLNDNLVFGVNYSRNRSSNLLQGLLLPSMAGISSITRNFSGVVQNTSWEFLLNASGGKSENFSWTTNINFTIPDNKLISFPDNDKLISRGAFGYVVGQSLGVLNVVKLLGVDPLTGRYVTEDAKGNPTFSPNYSTDRKVLINTQPRFYGGLSGGLGYKGVSMDITFRVESKKARRYYQAGIFSPGATSVNQPVSILDRWRKPGDRATYQRLVFPGNDFLALTDAAYEDASYIRLQNLSFSWNIPEHWLKSIRVKSCRLSVNMQNLATITRYSGLDPETGNSTLPPFRTIVLGVNVLF